MKRIDVRMSDDSSDMWNATQTPAPAQHSLSHCEAPDPAPERRQSSAGKALEILLALGELTLRSGGAVRLGDLVAQVGHPRPTVHRLLGDLRRSGFAVRDEASGQYRLGPKLLLLSAQCLGGLDLRRVAHPALRLLVEGVGHTAHLGILDGPWVVFIDKVESNHGVRIVSSIGQRREVTATALGKVLLAYAPEEVVAARLAGGMPARTPRSITSPGRMRAALAEIRDRGFALDDEECDLGIACVAAPVFDHLGQAAAAISVTMMISQIAPGEREHVGEETRRTAAAITEALGGWAPGR